MVGRCKVLRGTANNAHELFDVSSLVSSYAPVQTLFSERNFVLYFDRDVPGLVEELAGMGIDVRTSYAGVVDV